MDMKNDMVRNKEDVETYNISRIYLSIILVKCSITTGKLPPQTKVYIQSEIMYNWEKLKGNITIVHIKKYLRNITFNLNKPLKVGFHKIWKSLTDHLKHKKKKKQTWKQSKIFFTLREMGENHNFKASQIM